jgi:hypothetical protein
MEDNRKYLESIREELENIYNGKETDDDGEQVSFFDYVINEVLDISYIINADKSYKACELMITCGGPNVYINTRSHEIELFWGCDHETIWLPSEICEEIDAVCEDLYNN